MAEDGNKPDSENKPAIGNANHTLSGDFAKGNNAAAGHKQGDHAKANDFKKTFQAAITDQDIIDIAQKMVFLAKTGNVKAAKEVLDRCMGKPPQAVNIEGDINVNMTGLLELIDGSSKGKLPDSQEGENAG